MKAVMTTKVQLRAQSPKHTPKELLGYFGARSLMVTKADNNVPQSLFMSTHIPVTDNAFGQPKQIKDMLLPEVSALGCIICTMVRITAAY
jgi:hypothetical protein